MVHVTFVGIRVVRVYDSNGKAPNDRAHLVPKVLVPVRFQQSDDVRVPELSGLQISAGSKPTSSSYLGFRV